MKKKILISISIISVLFLAFSLSLGFWVNQWLKNNVEGDIHVSRLFVNPFAGSGRFSIKGQIPEKGTFDVRKLSFNVELLKLFSKQVVFSSLTFQDVSWDSKAKVDFLALKDLAINLTEKRTLVHYDNVIQIKNFSAELDKGRKVNLTTDAKVSHLAVALPKKEGKPDVEVVSVQLATGSVVSFRDEAYNPPLDLKTQSLWAFVGRVNTASTTLSTPIKLAVIWDETSRMDFQGRASLLASLPSGNVTGQIKNFNLSQLSPLTEKHIGYVLKAGLLDLKTDGEITQGKMKVNNDIHLVKLKLDRMKKEEQDATTNQLDIPVNTLLSVLRDKNKDIQINIPIEGDLSDPKVKVKDVMRLAGAKALKMVFRKTTENFLPPLKVARLTKTAWNFATKPRFKPILFNQGDSSLTSDAQAYLDLISEKLKEKTEVRINFCAQIAPSDLSVLGDTNKEAIRNFGTKRSDAVRDYLIEKHQIDQTRLLPCTPEVDSGEESQPRVDVSL